MRNYIAKDFKCDSWESVSGYYTELKNRVISTKADFLKWLKDKSELEAVLEEDMAWRYIRMTIDTTDEERAKAYSFFVNEIQPHLAPEEDALNKKMLEQQWVDELKKESEAYHIYFRGAETALKLFSEKNIPLDTELSELSQTYSGIIGAQQIEYKGETLTMPKAATLLKDPNPEVRETVYKLIVDRRAKDTDQLNELFSKMVKLRNQIALNAGCTDYRDYKFQSLGRFDYSVQDCLDFHKAIEEQIVPIVKELTQRQADKLGKSKLKPWDTEVDPDGLAPLKPFTNGEQLVDGSIHIFNELDPYFSSCLKTMKTEGYLDLDSKNGKAPGGYNYPLYESGIPFIFMNAAGAQRDVVTMVHEGGHAVHSFFESRPGTHRLQESSIGSSGIGLDVDGINDHGLLD